MHKWRGHKKLFFILAVFAILTAFVSGTAFPVKKLFGHWISATDLSYTGPGDVVSFDKKKYEYKLYKDALYHSGIAFTEDSVFVEYHNVQTGDSDNVFYQNERYLLGADSIVDVNSYSRHFRFKVLLVNSKKLSIKILPL
jgi:hypothetical protein